MHLNNLHKKHRAQGTRPSLVELVDVLQSVLADYSTVYVVIDALDECQDSDGTRHQFLNQLQALQSEWDMRLMITSRFIPDIISRFSEALVLEVRAHEQDVRSFVSSQVGRMPRCIQRDPELQNSMQESIAAAVDGM